jgi:hypothetical protein
MSLLHFVEMPLKKPGLISGCVCGRAAQTLLKEKDFGEGAKDIIVV